MFNPRARSRAVTSVLLVSWLLLSGIASAVPSISLSKKSGPPTSGILVSGSGFEPNVGVDIFFDTKDEALVVTNGEGEFHNAGAYAPRSAHPGKHWVTALERNNDKGAQKPFLVQTDWGQFRFSPDHEAANPYENVLNPKNVAGLGLRWTVKTGQGTEATAVVDGVIYLGAAKQITALVEQTGGSIWTRKIGGNILRPPVVADGILYVGADDLNLYALDAETGAFLWKYAAGSYVFAAPVVVGGVVYFGGADVIALNARTGAFLWRFMQSNPDSPSVATGNVFVGSDSASGDVVSALDATTGALKWMQVTGNYAQSPVVVNGSACTGAGDGVYSLSAETGALLWKFNAAGAYCGAIADNVAYVLAGPTDIDALDAVTGALLWRYSSSTGYSPGVPVLANGVVYLTFNGPFSVAYGNIVALDAHNGALLWSYVSDEHFADPVVVNGNVYASSYALGPPYRGHMNAFGLGRSGSVNRFATKQPEFITLHPDAKLRPFGDVTTATP